MDGRRPPSVALPEDEVTHDSRHDPPDIPSNNSANESLDQVETIRHELQELVSQDGIEKSVALAIMRLYHRMEATTMSMRGVYLREIDRLHHSIDQVNLKSEVNGLTLRQHGNEEQIRQLQSVNEQLQTLAAAPSVTRKR